MKETLRLGGLFLLSVSAGIFLCEFIVRMVAPQQLIYASSAIWQPDSLLGWKHVAGAYETINTGEKPVRVITDNSGFRTGPARPDCPTGKVLLLGDSFLEALQVEHDSTVGEFLRRRLRSDSGVNVCMENTGVGGWSPNQYYLQAQQLLRVHDYLLGIVFLYAGNDFVTRFDTLLAPRDISRKERAGIPASLSMAELKSKILYPINNVLEENSHLFVLFRSRSQVILSRVGLTAHYFPEIFLRSDSTSSRYGATADICLAIKGLFDAYNTPVLFVLLPAPYQVHEDVFDEHVRGFNINPADVDLEQPNRLFAQEMASRGLVLHDPLFYMRARASSGVQQFGAIDNHLNERGHETVAEYLAAEVAGLVSGVNRTAIVGR